MTTAPAPTGAPEGGPERDAETRARTFAQAADMVLEEARRSWTTPGTLAQWRRAMEVHAAPFRDKAAAQITSDDIVSGLAPLWTAKPALAAKVRKLWERVLDHPSARLGGAPDRPNPAAWTSALRGRLRGSPRPLRTTHVFTDLPPMMAQLRSGRGVGRMALELSVLTAVNLEAICSLRAEDVSSTDEGWGVTVEVNDSEQAEGPITAWRPLSGRAWSLVEPLYREGAARGARASVFCLPSGKALSARGVAELSTRIFSSQAARVSPAAVRLAFRAWAQDQARAAPPGSNRLFGEATVEFALGARLGDGLPQGGAVDPMPQEVRRLFEAWSVFLSQR